MRVYVKLFAAARDLAGANEIAVEVPESVTIADVRRVLADEAPRLAPLAARSMMAVNAHYADDDAIISPTDEVALIPPVSGG